MPARVRLCRCASKCRGLRERTYGLALKHEQLYGIYDPNMPEVLDLDEQEADDLPNGIDSDNDSDDEEGDPEKTDHERMVEDYSGFASVGAGGLAFFLGGGAWGLWGRGGFSFFHAMPQSIIERGTRMPAS